MQDANIFELKKTTPGRITHDSGTPPATHHKNRSSSIEAQPQGKYWAQAVLGPVPGPGRIGPSTGHGPYWAQAQYWPWAQYWTWAL